MTLLRIGLTGGIASGKSKVSELFFQKGIEVIDADEIARSLFAPNSSLLNELRKQFGSKVFNSDSSLDRKALGKIVFNSAKDLAWLNQLTHPVISKKIKFELSLVKSPYVILDIPLLVDKSGTIPGRLLELIDRVAVINVDRGQQISRLCNRDKISGEEAESIINTQSTLEQKMALSDDIIDNNGNLETLARQVDMLHERYLRISGEE